MSIDKFKEKMELVDLKLKKFKSLSDYKNNLTFTSLPNELALFKSDSVLKEKRSRWHEDLGKDIYIDEALNVLSDLDQIGLRSVVYTKNRKGKLDKID